MTLPEQNTARGRHDALVCLAGFMGSGKSTVGRLLAAQTGCRFVDLDERIEQAAGIPIREFFERHGEAPFRALEHETLGRILGELAEAGGAAVVALGGGTFAQPQNQELLRGAAAVVVWLDCPIEELIRRCATMTHRPLFRDESSLRQLYEQRLPSYRSADARVESGGEPREVIARILELACLERVGR
ncbi:MAG TPA: shikimate kinase [Candidatus Acidoferrales bacterium]|nr:shikimate kinase [Candidatus Acidoferrales bacterium]